MGISITVRLSRGDLLATPADKQRLVSSLVTRAARKGLAITAPAPPSWWPAR
ncbi:MAG TPA: hypothetical protein VG821_05405 [Rhizomicrobium sp.]|nr:hypothetical protein [Rhizomicrobium sp.]